MRPNHGLYLGLIWGALFVYVPLECVTAATNFHYHWWLWFAETITFILFQCGVDVSSDRAYRRYYEAKGWAGYESTGVIVLLQKVMR